MDEQGQLKQALTALAQVTDAHIESLKHNMQLFQTVSTTLKVVAGILPASAAGGAGAGGKKHRVKKEVDPTKPKRPASAFIKYMGDVRKTADYSTWEGTNQEKMQRVAKNWESLSENKKKPYLDAEATAVAAYKVALDQWRLSKGLPVAAVAGEAHDEDEDEDDDEDEAPAKPAPKPGSVPIKKPVAAAPAPAADSSSESSSESSESEDEAPAPAPAPKKQAVAAQVAKPVQPKAAPAPAPAPAPAVEKKEKKNKKRERE